MEELEEVATAEMAETAKEEMVVMAEMAMEVETITIQEMFHITTKISSADIHCILWWKIDAEEEIKVTSGKSMLNEKKKFKKGNSWIRGQNQFDFKKF